MTKFNFKSDAIVYCAMKSIQNRFEDCDDIYVQPFNAFNLNEMCLEFSDLLEERGITEYNFNSFLDNGWAARWKEYQESLMILKADELSMMTFVFFNFMEMFLRYTQQRFIYSEFFFMEDGDEYSDSDVLNLEALNSAVFRFEKDM